MLRQSDIAAAFRESILRSSKGFQCLQRLAQMITPLRRGFLEKQRGLYERNVLTRW